MSSTTDKIKGYANELAGTVRQGIGKIVGSDEMQIKGKAQEIKGEAQVGVAQAKDAVKETTEQVATKLDKDA